MVISVTQYAWYRCNCKDVLFQIHIICNDLHLKLKQVFYNKCCHLNCWGLFQTAYKMYMLSSWLFSVHGGLPASWPTHRISLTGYHWYHLSTTTKSTIYGTLSAVLLWLYIRRPQAVSFSLWHDTFSPPTRMYTHMKSTLGNTWQPLSVHLLLHFLWNCHMYLWPDHKWYM